MEKLDDITAKNLERLEQMEHRRQLKRYAEQKREKQRREALIFKIGKTVLDCWPWVAQLRVHPTTEENEAEFAPLRDLLLKIASDPNFITNADSFQHHQR